MKTVRPDAVIHCAAYTNVDGAEADYDGAFRINAVGTQNLAAGCLETAARLVYVSTDYVFDGKPGSLTGSLIRSIRKMYMASLSGMGRRLSDSCWGVTILSVPPGCTARAVTLPARCSIWLRKTVR